MNDKSFSCPVCQSPFGYLSGIFLICPECAHEWSHEENISLESTEEKSTFYDAHGTPLQHGDSVKVIKYLKVGGETIKSGTKVKSIRLLDQAVDGHDISCKIEGLGSIYLKSSVVKKC
jgi:protein PhnA